MWSKKTDRIQGWRNSPRSFRSSSFSSAVNRRFWEELLTQRKSNPLLSRHSAASVQSTDNGGVPSFITDLLSYLDVLLISILDIRKLSSCDSAYFSIRFRYKEQESKGLCTAIQLLGKERWLYVLHSAPDFQPKWLIKKQKRFFWLTFFYQPVFSVISPYEFS